MVAVVILPAELAGVPVSQIEGLGYITCMMEPGVAEEFCEQMATARARREKERWAAQELAGIVYDLAQGETVTPARMVLSYQKATPLLGLADLA